MENKLSTMSSLTKVSLKNLSFSSKSLVVLPSYKRSLIPQVVFAVLLISTCFNGSANTLLPNSSQSTFSLSVSVMLLKSLLLSHSLNMALEASLEKSLAKMRDEIEKAGLQNLEQKYNQHVKAYELQELAKRLARDEARFEAMAASMAQYAQLNDKAYDLGKSTHTVLQHIEQKLSIPIYAREEFKAGVQTGKAEYNMAAIERCVELQILIDKKPVTAEDELIKADSSASKNELKPSLNLD